MRTEKTKNVILNGQKEQKIMLRLRHPSLIFLNFQTQ